MILKMPRQKTLPSSLNTRKPPIHPDNAQSKRPPIFLNTILTRDIGDKFGELFQYIAERRQRDTSDELFVPDNDTEYKDLTHTSFLECALSFEGEYDRTQETKMETKRMKYLTGPSIQVIKST